MVIMAMSSYTTPSRPLSLLLSLSLSLQSGRGSMGGPAQLIGIGASCFLTLSTARVFGGATNHGRGADFMGHLTPPLECLRVSNAGQHVANDFEQHTTAVHEFLPDLDST